MLQQICKIASNKIIWLLMIHDKPCIQFCLFVFLLTVRHVFCLLHIDYLVELAQRSNTSPSWVAPCIYLYRKIVSLISSYPRNIALCLQILDCPLVVWICLTDAFHYKNNVVRLIVASIITVVTSWQSGIRLRTW